MKTYLLFAAFMALFAGAVIYMGLDSPSSTKKQDRSTKQPPNPTRDAPLDVAVAVASRSESPKNGGGYDNQKDGGIAGRVIVESTSQQAASNNSPKKIETPDESEENYHEDFAALNDENLAAFVADPATEELRRSRALEILLKRIEEMQDRGNAFEMLIFLKDRVADEDQQFVLKVLAAESSEAANEAIIDTFAKSFYSEDTVNLARMLSYIRPQQPLKESFVEELTGYYATTQDDMLASVIINTIAAAGGDAGTQWLIEQAEEAEGTQKEGMLVDALGHSRSQDAFDYLNRRLDDLAAENDASEESKAQIRQTILSLRESIESER